MTDQIAFAANPRERRNRLPVKRVGGRLKQALDLMVWGDGERRYFPDNEAAAIAGMHVLAIRSALQKPHVLSYYKQQREVLRNRESAANIHRLCEIRDADNNMPAVNAIKALEQLSDEQSNKTQHASPGVTIRIVTNATPAQHAIDVTPNIPAIAEQSDDP
jgi:hypothetical protein